MSDVSFRGAEDFLRVSKALKAAGDKELRKELNKSLREAAKPIIKATRAAALEQLPKRGGLAAQVAREPQRVQVRTGAKTAGVRIVVGRRRGGARMADQGLVRHPLFGDREHWYTTKVPEGWFTDTGQEQLPQVRGELLKAVAAMADRIARGR